ncbi:ABC transporter permease [Chelativorans intermedius]|uniref:ABC transporter permease n=1 Tax=Chelativorans intermedius TaxID=515947 RepID=A0ABV6D2E2_9HYPH|nr:ABC transporter permease [Chelativorans intermedius]MCT8997382.1 ABC transporter permease [Chelativorans intermedius]
MQANALDILLRRLLGFAGVMFVLSLMIFVLARIVPGDPARIALGPSATQEQVDAMRQEMGLDQPVLVQYLDYAASALKGDFGRSLISGKPVSGEILELLPATLELVIVTVFLMIAISVPLGVTTARFRNSWIDNAGRFFSIVGVTMPSFLFAILLQLLAANFLPGWPILGRIDHSLSLPSGPTGLLLVDSVVHGRGDVFLSALQHIAFPALALAMAGIGQVTRITRSAMIEHQRRDHVLTLKSFGVPDRVIVFRYLLKLSSIAPLTIMGLEFASLIGNAFVVEMVFSWGGFASYGLEAILQKDLNAVMAVVLVSGFFFIVANLVIDVVLLIIDPRLRFKEAR